MKRNVTRRAVALGCALVVGLSMAACSKDEKKGTVAAPSAGTVATAGTTPTTPAVTVSEKGMNDVPALSGAASIIQDLSQTKCDGGPGKATAAGTVVNRADKEKDIVVTAFWTKPGADKPVAQSSAVLKQVKPNATAGFEITNEVPGGKDDFSLCGLRVQAGTLK